MTTTHISFRIYLRAMVAISIMSCGVAQSQTHVGSPDVASGATQKSFATPDAAISALLAAAKGMDTNALHEIFGNELDRQLTGDRIEDSTDLVEFSTALAQRCDQSHRGSDTITLIIGSEQWPFPIPLQMEPAGWRFNTAAGKEEIISRHIGEDELNTIGVCHAYVQAQRDYASQSRDSSGVVAYAQRFRSAAGTRNGLYWESVDNEPLSPFGPLVAEAQAEGYTSKPLSKSKRPFHGYFFKILTAQGPAATGGEYNYVINGNMVAGFALVAYPARWGESGIMTFIVNQQGTVYEANLGEKSEEIALQLTAYNPDGSWKPVARETAKK